MAEQWMQRDAQVAAARLDQPASRAFMV